MELDIKYHVAENLFRSFWINLLEKELANKDLAGYQIIGEEEGLEPILTFDEFDIEIELIPNAKNRSLKLRLLDEITYALSEKYLKDNDLESISHDDEYPFITETTFTIRDIKKGTRFYSIVKKYRGV